MYVVAHLGPELKLAPTLTGTIEHVYGPEHACSPDGKKQLTINKPGYLGYQCFKGNPSYENHTCNWLIQAPTGYVISIDDIQCDGCGERKDMKVYDYKIGPNNILPFKYLEYGRVSTPVYSSANTLYVTANLTFHWKYGFCDDRQMAFIFVYGFHFNFTLINQKACSSVENLFQVPFSIGGFTSPGFPDIPPINQKCRWLIFAGSKYQLFVQFYALNLTGFALEDGKTLTIYDGKTEKDPILAELRGSYQEMPFFGSNSSYLLLVFQNTKIGSGLFASPSTNNVDPEWGFRLRFNVTENAKNSLACSNKRPLILTERKGKITIPTYAVWFRSFRATPQCEWIVQAPDGYVINVKTIYMLHLCDCDYPYDPDARKYLCRGCPCLHGDCYTQNLYIGRNTSQVSKQYIGKYCCMDPKEALKTGAPVFFFDFSTFIYISGMQPEEKYEYNANFSLEYEMKSVNELACSNPGHVELSVDDVIEVPGQRSNLKSIYGQQCQWNLIGNPDQAISLYIDTLDFDCNCSKASLNIFRGPTPKHALVFETCCNQTEKEIHIENDTLTIVLNHTGYRKSKGKLFQAHYEFIPRTDIACNTLTRPYNATVSPGVISSPGFRDGSTAWATMKTGLNCQWLIVAPPGEKIKLHVSFMLGSVTPGNDCDNSGCTTVYDGNSVNAPVMSISETDIPADYTSKSRFILIQFVTKTRKQVWDYSGFHFSYEFITPRTWVEKYWYILLAIGAGLFAMILLIVFSFVRRRILKRKSGESILNLPSESDDHPSVSDNNDTSGNE